MALGLMTPTQFIYRAALKTPIVPVAMEKQVVYADVPLVDVTDGRCWLCGGETGGRGQPVRKAIKDTFTDCDKASAPQSKSVCPGCTFCLSFTPLRNYSILATEQGLQHPTRPEIRDLLIEPPEPPFVLCIAVSGQKWLHFRGQVAYSRDGYPVQMEETRVYVDRTLLAEQLDLVERLYTIFTKEEIKTGHFGQNRIKQFGIARFEETEGKTARHRGTRLFDLAVFVAQKREVEIPASVPEKNKEEPCIITSTPKTTNQQLQLF